MSLTQNLAPTIEAEVRLAEARLRRAMLASDVQELDQLIDDRLVFAGPDGRLYSKQDDLNLHRSGAQQIDELAIKELSVEVHGAFAVSTVLARVSGRMRGAGFDGRFRYLRTWAPSPTGWRIVAGSISVVPS